MDSTTIILRDFINMGKTEGNGVELARGYNSFRELYSGCSYGRHAETDAMKKLETNPYGKFKKGKKKDVDLVVISVTKTGVLANSKPCSKCIQHLNNLQYHKIKNIYYSTTDGIVKERFNVLNSASHKHVSRRFR